MSKQRIYSSTKCALCNTALDTIPLIPALFCSVFSGSRLRGLNEILLDIRFNFNTSHCSVMFFLPSEAENTPRSLLECYNDLQTTCLTLECDDEKQNLCENGPFLPVYDNKWLRNIYCKAGKHVFCPAKMNNPVFAKHVDILSKSWSDSLMILLTDGRLTSTNKNDNKVSKLEVCDELEVSLNIFYENITMCHRFAYTLQHIFF